MANRTCAVLVFLSVLASEASAACAPRDAELFLHRLLPEAAPEQPPAAGGSAYFVLDTSTGMSGFIRRNSDADTEMAFQSVVGAAVDAFSASRVRFRLSGGSDTDLYVLANTKRWHDPELLSTVEPCETQGCGKIIEDTPYTPFQGESRTDLLLEQIALGQSVPALDRSEPLGPNDLLVLVTDLQNPSTGALKGAGQLGGFISSFLSQSESQAAVFGFMSSFNGPIFDLPYREPRDPLRVSNTEQPFFVVVLGGEPRVADFVGRFKDEIDSTDQLPSFSDKVSTGRALPPMITHESLRPPSVAEVEPIASESRSVELASGVDVEVPIVRIKHSELISGTGPVAEITLAEMDLPDPRALMKHCWILSPTGPPTSQQPICNGTADAPSAAKMWLDRPHVPNLVLEIVAMVRRILSRQGDDTCDQIGWQFVGEQFGRSDEAARPPFHAELALTPTADGTKARLSLRLFAESNRVRDLVLRDDEWLVEISASMQSHRVANEPGWLQPGSGWHLLPARAATAAPPVGVGGLAEFYGAMLADLDEPVIRTLEATRAVILAVE
ncbi:MAG: hypothetical protein AAFR21_16740 [Pseudomonadota bacterium]